MESDRRDSPREVEEVLGATRSQRAAGRSGYRHGRKLRRFILQAGTVKLAVPRARLINFEGEEREWRSQPLPRYRRSSLEVERAVLGMYLPGGNTRADSGSAAEIIPFLSASGYRRILPMETGTIATMANWGIANEGHIYCTMHAE